MSQASQTTQLLLTTQQLESLQQQQKLLGSTAPILLSTQHLDPQQQAQLQQQLQQQQQLLQFQQFNLPQPPPPPLQLLQAPPPPPPVTQPDGMTKPDDGHVGTASSPTAVTDLSQITLSNGPTNLPNNNTPASPLNTTPVREKKKAKRSLKIPPNVSNNIDNKNVKSPGGRPPQLYQPPPPPPPPLETRSVEGESSDTSSPAKRLVPSDGAEAAPSGGGHQADSTTSEGEVSSTTNDGNEDHGSRASSEEVSVNI